MAPEKVSGRATVAAFSVDRQPWIPGFEPPYIVAIVEIAEEPGVRLITNVVDVEPEDMRIGLEVEVFFEDWTALSGGEDTRVWIPLFRPVAPMTGRDEILTADDGHVRTVMLNRPRGTTHSPRMATASWQPHCAPQPPTTGHTWCC